MGNPRRISGFSLVASVFRVEEELSEPEEEDVKMFSPNLLLEHVHAICHPLVGKTFNFSTMAE